MNDEGDGAERHVSLLKRCKSLPFASRVVTAHCLGLGLIRSAPLRYSADASPRRPSIARVSGPFSVQIA